MKQRIASYTNGRQASQPRRIKRRQDGLTSRQYKRLMHKENHRFANAD